MRSRRALPALFAVLVLVIGQVAALAHAASTRHITCSEHGEELETTRLAETLHACDDDHLVGLAGDTAADHADCVIARVLHASTTPTTPFIALAVAETTSVVVEPSAGDVTRPRAVYRLAPKTSPPRPS